MPEQLWDAAGEFRVVAPSTKSTRIFLVVFGAMTGIGGLITLTIFPRGEWTIAGGRVLGYGLVMVIMGGLAVGFLLLWSANARLLIGRGAVGYRSSLRRTRFWSTGDIGRVVDMALDYGRMTQTGQRAIYIFGPDGKRLLALTPRMWNANDLRDFIEATGVQLDRRDAPVPIKTARREFPKGFTWGSQHMLTMGCLLTLAVIGAVIAGAILFVR
jgi:hypothetical protein